MFRSIRATALVLAVAAAAASASACSGVAAPATVAPSPAPPTFEAFSATMCSSFTSLFRAVGNPDANTPSVMSKALDDAVRSGDAAAADVAASAIIAELEAARAQALDAARYQPAAATMGQLEKLILAYEVMTGAKKAVAARLPGAIDPGVAFKNAGGVTAWQGTVSGIGRLQVPAGASPQPCRAFSGQA
jgi:hypothetical protein